MELRQLRYFVAVARERNFTRAAEQLNIAQPPLSRQIQQLEDELGVLLIKRDSRPISLTDAGRVFYEQAIQILGRVEQMQAATRRVGLQQRSVLSIGYVASSLYGGLPLLLRKLRQAAPELDVQLLELITVQQVDALKEGRIDIGFGRVPHSDPAVAGLVLHEEPLAVAVHTASLMARDTTPMPIGRITGQRLIVYPKEPRPSFADEVLNVVHGHGVQPAEVLEVREIQTALGLVAAEFGVCLIPASARQLRQDVHFRLIDSDRAVSPVIVNYRANDTSKYVELAKSLLTGLYP
ncbi:MAG: LysR family transcriptional regulator [Pigmentiphaga sp.]|nr:LysR family transcriptional regulator [Pigmentiphaga sp.]